MKQITISDIEGFQVGQAQDTQGGSGCTVILCEGAAVQVWM